ncbi:MAG: MATE family efflux transporter, partial [Clostridia bacterium]|nr:MATE family efflux transporter [Clostridia bacterium]
METGNRHLGTESVGKLMRRYAVPCVISLLVGALYNIVDQIFIANASYLGSYGNAANTVVFPLTVVALAIAVMIGDGCCAFVSMALGRGEVERAKRSVGSAVVLSVGSSVVLTAVYLLLADELIAMFGGTVNEETFRYSREYFFYIALGMPFYMFGQAMNPVIRADGSPRFAMVSTLAGAVVNLVLDPIFIFVFHWGMMGAAVATVIGQAATAALAVWYLLHMKIIKPARGDFALRRDVCARMLTLGVTSFLSQISLVAAMAAINNMLRKYGALDAVFGQEAYAQIPMAVVGIVMKFFQIVISIVVGMAAGCIPIVGYNMGAEKRMRVRQLFTRLLIAEALVGAAALVLAEVFPRQLIALFGAANESAYYTEFAVKAFRVYLCLMVPACVNKACFIFLQAVGRALASTLLSMFREVVFGVGFALLLPVFFGLDGVLYSMPVSDALTF